MGAKPGAGDDIELVFGKARHRQVGLDTATAVQKLRVCEPTHGTIDGVGTEPRECRDRILAAHHILRKGRLVENAGMLANMMVLTCDGIKPVLAAHRVDVALFVACPRKPVGPFPTQLGAEHGILAFQRIIER